MCEAKSLQSGFRESPCKLAAQVEGIACTGPICILPMLVYIPGGTALLFSSTFEALGKENQWFDWLPGAIQASVLLLRPIQAVTGE